MSRANVAEAGRVPIARTSARTVAGTKPSLSTDRAEPSCGWWDRDGMAGEVRSMSVSSCGGTREIRAYAVRLATLSTLPDESRMSRGGRGAVLRPPAAPVKNPSLAMKEGIHPRYEKCAIVCACGNVIETRSTRESIHVEICSACHPFFTGKQKLMDTAGRVERFNRKYGKKSAASDAGASTAG